MLKLVQFCPVVVTQGVQFKIYNNRIVRHLIPLFAASPINFELNILNTFFMTKFIC